MCIAKGGGEDMLLSWQGLEFDRRQMEKEVLFHQGGQHAGIS